MGFHKRYINNEVVHRLFKSGGAPSVFDWYTRGVDALIVETGLSTRISNVINDIDWQQMGRDKIEDHIVTLIQEDLDIKDIIK